MKIGNERALNCMRFSCHWMFMLDCYWTLFNTENIGNASGLSFFLLLSYDQHSGFIP